ncbi:unnamed protein product [Didymodactylos carnosus]|uniref:Uncharacterized protein n=1 Tax=Didymodactylos carnosus TaxID=1234261 RepID=A0A814BB88_9BILA|nr:unnamed protein product [Didymodactylos carnosus]CAF0925241.1 unnamed protein product [Didymodactylos carnosus]CAF3504904.1 unnamed protein product [Didymodactylos carnosus]CAF3703970.1 unnamed protein product [Didymodactylos carnosus]
MAKNSFKKIEQSDYYNVSDHFHEDEVDINISSSMKTSQDEYHIDFTQETTSDQQTSEIFLNDLILLSDSEQEPNDAEGYEIDDQNQKQTRTSKKMKGSDWIRHISNNNNNNSNHKSTEVTTTMTGVTVLMSESDTLVNRKRRRNRKIDKTFVQQFRRILSEINSSTRILSRLSSTVIDVDSLYIQIVRIEHVYNQTLLYGKNLNDQSELIVMIDNKMMNEKLFKIDDKIKIGKKRYQRTSTIPFKI